MYPIWPYLMYSVFKKLPFCVGFVSIGLMNPAGLANACSDIVGRGVEEENQEGALVADT